MSSVDYKFQQRRYDLDTEKPDDPRTEYDKDLGRIVHSSGFRRLQGKTQVFGIGEGDFHRTRLTHSMEVGQIGVGLCDVIKSDQEIIETIGHQDKEWLPGGRLMLAICLAHDLGHPPFGHGGEKALHQEMVGFGGFEGNAQTIRILTKLEKKYPRNGINPTRRTLLGVLKYPVSYSSFSCETIKSHPPKCHYDSEKGWIDWVLELFSSDEIKYFSSVDSDNAKSKYMGLDASIMECADDIAYCVHDLEDVIARGLVKKERFLDLLNDFLSNKNLEWLGTTKYSCGHDDFKGMFDSSHERKRCTSKLIHLFMTNVELTSRQEFSHPLLKYHLAMKKEMRDFYRFIKDEIIFDLVVHSAEVQMLERKGERVVSQLYKEIIKSPDQLIPGSYWHDLDSSDSLNRRVCDYISGMTDSYAVKIYHRLFTPGVGSSRDEL